MVKDMTVSTDAMVRMSIEVNGCRGIANDGLVDVHNMSRGGRAA